MATNEGRPVIIQSVRDVRQRVRPKSQWLRQAAYARHALNPRSFFLSQYWPTENNWTDRNNQEWCILVHLRVQLSFRKLTLTLRSKGRVLTCVTSWYVNLASKQLYNWRIFWFIVYFVVIHWFGLLWHNAGRLAFNCSLRFVWKVTKLCRVEVVSPTVTLWRRIAESG